MEKDITLDNSSDFLNLGIDKENYFLFVNQVYMRLIREGLYKSIYFFLSYNLRLIYPFLTRKSLQKIEKFGIKTNINISIAFQKLILVFSFLKAFLLIIYFIRKIRIRGTVQVNNPSKNMYIIELHNLFIYRNRLIIDKDLFKNYSINIENFFYKKNLENVNLIDFYPNIFIYDYFKFFFKSLKILTKYHNLNFFLKFKISEIIETNFLFYSYKNSKFNNLLFSESYRINRPLWSYSLERIGWNIIYYNYSTNQSDEIKFYPENYIPGEFKYFSFNKSIFSNDELFQYYKSKSLYFDSNKSVVNSNLFYFKDKFRKISHKKYIVSIFDSIIFDKHITNSIPRPYWYYEKKNIINFYKDILECLNKIENLIIIIKSKDKNLYYNKIIEDNFQNALKNKIYKISNINTFKLIVKSDLVISIPFSTPSMIAKINNINSIYYDPSGKLVSNKLESKIKLINLKKDLLNKLEETLI